MTINLSSPKITLEDCVLELKDQLYDRLKLLEIFEETKQYGRVKGLPWNDNSKPISHEESTCIMIQASDYMIIDPKEHGKGCNLLEFDYIKKLVSPLNFSHEILNHNIDIIWNKPGFKFRPHVDHYAMSTMMWPIIPETEIAPVDFYHRSNMEFQIPKDHSYMTDDDIVFSHNYVAGHPVIFNSHIIHGVRLVSDHRAHLRLRINEDFISIREKYRNGTLIKK